MKKRKVTQVFWDMPEEEFKQLIKASNRWKNIFDHFNMSNGGWYLRQLKIRINELNIDTSHFLDRIKSSVFGRTMEKQTFENEWLVKNCERSNGQIKKYILKFNTINYECESCKNSGAWLNKELVLQLEHKNGDNRDNRIENLCFLCPNCHSQTDTFARSKPLAHHSCKCGQKKQKYSETCVQCLGKRNRHVNKINWPDDETFQNLLWEKSMVRIGKELGTSCRTVRDHAISRGLSRPENGYWVRKKFNH